MLGKVKKAVQIGAEIDRTEQENDQKIAPSKRN
jgi:hypothetical protein